MSQFKIKWFGAWIFTIWPLFLFFSQKALVPLKLVELFGAFTGKKLKLFFLGMTTMFVLSIILLLSLKNSFAISHYLSVIVFVLFVILFGAENLKSNRIELNLKWITILNFLMLILALVFYYLQIELSSFRGLNFVKDNTGTVNRMFLETSSLFVISNFRSKSKLFNILLITLTFSYLVFLNKSVFLIALFLYQLILQYQVQKKRIFLFVVTAILTLILLSFPELFLRADLAYSIAFKLSQVEGIIDHINLRNFLFGEGFGFFLSDFATDETQPYQIENQLAMLLLQLGLGGLIILLIFFYYFFCLVIPDNRRKAFFLYFLIGIINPWLFLPSWLITATYFFKLKSNV